MRATLFFGSLFCELILVGATAIAQDPRAQQSFSDERVDSAIWEVPAPSFQPTNSPQSAATLDVIPAIRQSNIFGSVPSAVQQASATSTPSRQVIDPNTLVLNAIHQAVFGPTFTCKVYQQSVAFGQSVVLSGDYKSAGNGTGQFKYTARVSSGETTFDYEQTSDGRLMYSQMGKQPPRMVNVEKVREIIAPRLQLIKESPEISIHLAIGGHAELLRSLYQRYNWHGVVAGKSENVEVWQLLGRLRTEPPRVSGSASLDIENLRTESTDEGLPPGVRLTIGRSASASYFPYSVEYFRMKKDKEGKAIGPIAVSRVRYIEPTYNVPFNESDFVIRPDSEADTSVQETDLYIPH